MLVEIPSRLSSSNKEEQKSFDLVDQNQIPKQKCLIVNDDPSQLYFLQILFELESFEVITAQNG